MIPCRRTREPSGFGVVRRNGAAWLRANSTPDAQGKLKDPPSTWRDFYAELEKSFDGRCAYTAMAFASGPGTVDHFISVKEARHLAYEWWNYRPCMGWLNSSKQSTAASKMLDPFEVKDGWFEIDLANCWLTVTASCPASHRARAEYMVREWLGSDERVVHYRKQWLALFRNGDLSLNGLAQKAPLLAAAVRKRIAAGLTPLP